MDTLPAPTRSQILAQVLASMGQAPTAVQPTIPQMDPRQMQAQQQRMGGLFGLGAPKPLGAPSSGLYSDDYAGGGY